MAGFRKLLPALLLFSCTLASPVSDFSTKEETEDKYRLPNIYKDIYYSLALTIPEEALTTPDKNTYSGSVAISFAVTEQTSSLKLHASKNYITIKTLTVNGETIPNINYSVDGETDILTVKYELRPEVTYTLAINYDALLSTKDMAGFYKSSYESNGQTRYLATTQFESTDARRALPCFDEPSIKGTFALQITVPNAFNAISNTPISQTMPAAEGYKMIHFKQTKQMSTYLLAFIVSDFTCSQGEDAEGANKIPTQVCSRNNTLQNRAFAVDVAPKVIRVLNDFTQLNYSLYMEKMDEAAIPDFSAGAMENWGLVTYRERLLLLDLSKTSDSNKQSVATVIAHEFSHQWFGDLVTCNWWSEIYLNEGFATYFEYHATAQIFPEWELEKQFVTDVVQVALAYDSYNSIKPLKSDVSTPTEIEARFDTVSYEKGGSILRMVQHIMGLDRFKVGLKQYLLENQFGSGTSEKLFQTLSNYVPSTATLPAEKTLSDVMTNWIEQPGYPLVRVEYGPNDSVTLTQERFLLGDATKAAAQTGWYVPISYTTSKDDKKFVATNPTAWIVPSSTNVSTYIVPPEDATWIVLNNQQTGYYRVVYEGDLLTNIVQALKEENFGGIIDLNRAQIVDDIFNVAKVGIKEYGTVFQLVDFLQNDDSYYSWKAAFNGFDYLLKRVGQDSNLGKAIGDHVLRLSKTLLASVPLDSVKPENQIYTLNQVQALTWACKLGNQECVDGVAELYREFRNSGTRPDPNLESVVYCNALRYSQDSSSSDWDFLWNQYLTTDVATEQVLLLSALGCTKDDNLLKGYLEKSITNTSGIRLQDGSSVFSAVYSNNPEGVDVAFQFLVENYQQIADSYQSLSALSNIINGIADRFTNERQLQDLRDFIDLDDIPTELKTASTKALETAEANLRWVQTYQEQLNSYYKLTKSDGVTFKTSVLVVLLGFLLVSLS